MVMVIDGVAWMFKYVVAELTVLKFCGVNEIDFRGILESAHSGGSEVSIAV